MSDAVAYAAVVGVALGFFILQRRQRASSNRVTGSTQPWGGLDVKTPQGLYAAVVVCLVLAGAVRFLSDTWWVVPAFGAGAGLALAGTRTVLDRPPWIDWLLDLGIGRHRGQVRAAGAVELLVGLTIILLAVATLLVGPPGDA